MIVAAAAGHDLHELHGSGEEIRQSFGGKGNVETGEQFLLLDADACRTVVGVASAWTEQEV